MRPLANLTGKRVCTKDVEGCGESRLQGPNCSVTSLVSREVVIANSHVRLFTCRQSCLYSAAVLNPNFFTPICEQVSNRGSTVR